MNPYHDSKIYKIINDIDDAFYIGSTYQSLENRLKEHIKRFKNNLNF